MAYPSSDSSEATNAANAGSPQTSLGDPALEERFRSDEAFPRQATENLERRRAESTQLHRTHDESARLATLAQDEIEPAARRRAEEEDSQLAEEEAIRLAAESEAELRATEKQRLSALIKTLGQTATEQIDHMDEAKAPLTILEQIRVHAETKVCENAEREIRLQAEIEALRQTEEAQFKRIEEAETEARRLIEEQNRVRAAAEARRMAEAEARQRASEEELQRVADEARRIAEDEEQRLEHIVAIRARAEAAARQRADKEQLLSSQLLGLGEAAAEQLRRIEKAETDLSEAEEELRQLEEKARETVELAAIRLTETETRRQATAEELAHTEAEARSPAEKEEQRLAELESLRSQAKTKAQHRREQEQRLIAEIEALNKAEAEQLNRIADAESALRAREEELKAAEFEVSQEDVDRRTGLLTDSSDESERLPNYVQDGMSNAETATASSASKQSDRSSVNVREVVQFGGEERVALYLLDPLENTIPGNSTEDSGKSIHSVFSEQGITAASGERPIVTLLAERFRIGDPAERANALQQLAGLDENGAFSLITGLFDDSSEEVRNAAARSLYDLSTDRANAFTQALGEAPPQRRRQIITALVASGLVAEAIESLAGESREKTHDAFSLLFLIAQAGEVESLLQTIAMHPNIPVRLSVIKLLTLSNRPDIIPALRSLVVRGALPIDVRSALMESIYQMSSSKRERSPSAA